MTFLVERIADLRRQIEHLRDTRRRVGDADDLRRDLSLHNDVLFSLLVVCQAVIDIAGELASRRGLRFQDYTEAIQALDDYDEFPGPLIRELTKLPGFRNVLVHEYVELDYGRVLEAVRDLEPVEEFARIAAGIEQTSQVEEDDDG